MPAPKAIPLYERVKNHILSGIGSGQWKVGARLPSEHELMAQLGASRMTVHRALRELSAAGVLVRIQGVGSFAAARKPVAALLEITDIADDIFARGHRHRSKIIALEAIRADADLAARFALRRGAKIFHSVILHFEDEAPVQLEERFVSPKFAPDFLAQDFTETTTARYLLGIAPPIELEHVIDAVAPDERTRFLLQIDALEPCLRLQRRTWSESGPATRSILIHPGSRYSLGGRYNLPTALANTPV
jgi:GntR family histidine utilization transcriptional repressor